MHRKYGWIHWRSRVSSRLVLGALAFAGCGDSAPPMMMEEFQSPDLSCDGVEVLARDQENVSVLEINSTHVFWATQPPDPNDTSPYTYVILRAPLAGGPATEVIRYDGLSAVFTVDDDNVYFLDCADADSGVGPCSVRQVPVAGGTPTVRIDAVFTPHQLLTRDGSVYYAESTIGGRLFRFAAAGGDPVVLATGNDANPGGTAPNELDVAGGFVYFAEGGNVPNSEMIKKAPIDGGAVTTLAGPVGDDTGQVVVLGDRVHFAQTLYDGDVARTVVRSVAIAGGEVQDVAELEHGEGDMATDGVALYVITSRSNGLGGGVWKIAAGGEPVMFDCGIGRGYSLAVDATHAYWVDNQANAVFRKRL